MATSTPTVITFHEYSQIINMKYACRRISNATNDISYCLDYLQRVPKIRKELETLVDYTQNAVEILRKRIEEIASVEITIVDNLTYIKPNKE